MTKFLRKTLTAAAIAAALAAGSAGAADSKAAAKPVAHPAPAAAAAPAVDKAAIDAKFKGNKKAEYSYMVGMDVGRGLSSIKDDIDIKVVIQALEATLKGEKTTLTDAEALSVRGDFMEKLRGEQMAKMKVEAEKNQKEGDDFLAKNKTKKGVKVTASGLQYEVIKQGSGPKPVKTDSVTVNYVGTKIDGTEFDSSIKRGQPAKFPLANVIPGWTEGLQLMPVGSEYKFFIPAKLAYGEHGPPQIGPDATLVFDVTLISIDKPEAAKPAVPAEPKKD
ncbi:MAG: FKBP-type peptidyl-prolyl cis-trans isomerase [Xanthomonadaceae bacterium]|nr:FKBP-type peptidyl-prolyl cis-trans isomerase [Xanthomonadaceae bacterium]MDE2083838.1 FKBP-type peptidyl-prolyl cis-trans isomerase [Xanthomonadaceae bacterium]MDE2256313.1 FKBP-type peptidyl-prolyl cis-trans isomerase [Xanthomonadaceae bacterium]